MDVGVGVCVCVRVCLLSEMTSSNQRFACSWEMWGLVATSQAWSQEPSASPGPGQQPRGLRKALSSPRLQTTCATQTAAATALHARCRPACPPPAGPSPRPSEGVRLWQLHGRGWFHQLGRSRREFSFSGGKRKCYAISDRNLKASELAERQSRGHHSRHHHLNQMASQRRCAGRTKGSDALHS